MQDVVLGAEEGKVEMILLLSIEKLTGNGRVCFAILSLCFCPSDFPSVVLTTFLQSY